MCYNCIKLFFWTFSNTWNTNSRHFESWFVFVIPNRRPSRYVFCPLLHFYLMTKAQSVFRNVVVSWFCNSNDGQGKKKVLHVMDIKRSEYRGSLCDETRGVQRQWLKKEFSFVCCSLSIIQILKSGRLLGARYIKRLVSCAGKLPVKRST
jgi:hypothetical protein